MGRLLDDPPHTQTLTERQLEEPMAKKSTSTKTTKLKAAKAKSALSSNEGEFVTSTTFTAADGGAHTFPVTLRTAGPQTITVADTENDRINGTAGTIKGAEITGKERRQIRNDLKKGSDSLESWGLTPF